MGEKNTSPKETQNSQADNMNETVNGTSENPPGEEMDTNSQHDDNTDDEGSEENVDMTPEEFAALDGQLDALNSALDDIEQKNEDIHSQLLQLLHANREVRQQLQQDNNNSTSQLEPSKTNERKQ